MELLCTSCPGWGQESGPGSAVPPSGLEKWRQWAAVTRSGGPCQRAAVVCEGQNEAEGEKIESGEWRKAMGFSVYLQLLFLMEG